MGRISTRESKTIYQICREESGLSREKASELMDGMSTSRIEKIEYEAQRPTPYDIVQMADCYKRPDLCNYYCSHRCEIGDRYVPEVEVSELSNIILETIASLNDISPLTNRLIQIARDGRITDDEIPDFAYISSKLDEVSLAVNALNLWVEKTAGQNQLNFSLFNSEKEKLKNKLINGHADTTRIAVFFYVFFNPCYSFSRSSLSATLQSTKNRLYLANSRTRLFLFHNRR